MRQAVMCLGVAFALVIGVAASVHAQQGQGNANAQEKKQKRQVPDNGSGQSDLAADTTFERVVTSVPVTVRADGTIVVELNDSFMEAQTATIAPDGSLRYDHITGLQRTAEFVRAQTPSASTLLPSREPGGRVVLALSLSEMRSRSSAVAGRVAMAAPWSASSSVCRAAGNRLGSYTRCARCRRA